MFDKLKKLFIVSDEEFTKNESGQNEEVQKTETSTPPKSSIPAPIEIQGSADPKFIDILLGAIEKNNMEGFDYLEFKQSLQNLGDIQMEEATRYNSALAMAKTMGATPESITSSAQQYLNILKVEDQKFQKALLAQQQKIDNEKSSGLTQIQSTIKQKEEEIARLNQEILDLKDQLNQKSNSIEASSKKISETNNQFAHAYKMIVQQIVNDIQKISDHS